MPSFKNLGVSLKAHLVLSVRGRTILFSCSIRLAFYILPYSDWPKGYTMNYLLFDLFKSLLLLRDPFKIILHLCHLLEGAYNHTNLKCSFSKIPQCLKKLVFISS